MNGRHSQLSTPLFLGGINIVALLLFFLLYTGGHAADDKPVLLTSGEWAPYSGEQLPNHGIASAIVTTVIENMGYRPQIRFLPWTQAQRLAESAENDSDVRGSFPYARVPRRESRFYFSLPILKIPQSVYFNPTVINQHNLQHLRLPWQQTARPDLDRLKTMLPAAAYDAFREYSDTLLEQLSETLDNLPLKQDKQSQLRTTYYRQINDLLLAYLAIARCKAHIIRIEGYEYPPVFDDLLDNTSPPAQDNRAAFQQLIDSTTPLVVMEATRVAEKTLWDHFRQESGAVTTADNSPRISIRSMTLSFRIAAHLMVGKGNPENLRFINDFNRELVSLQNDGTIAQLQKSVTRELEENQLVALYPVKPGDHLLAYVSATPDSDYVLLSPGTKAVVLTWSRDYLLPQHNHPPSPGRIQVRIRQGPNTDKLFYIDGRSIRFP